MKSRDYTESPESYGKNLEGLTLVSGSWHTQIVNCINDFSADLYYQPKASGQGPKARSQQPAAKSQPPLDSLTSSVSSF